MKIELELFIPDRSLLLYESKSIGEIAEHYNLDILHIHNDPVLFDFRKDIDPNIELKPDMIIKVYGEREDVGRFSKDCLTLVSA